MYHLYRPSGRRRFCAVNSEPLEAAENCAGAALPARALKSPKGGATSGSGTQKERHDLRRVFLFGTAEGIRTPDLLVRSQTLYPTELQPHTVVVLNDSSIILAQFRSECKPFLRNSENFSVRSEGRPPERSGCLTLGQFVPIMGAEQDPGAPGRGGTERHPGPILKLEV